MIHDKHKEINFFNLLKQGKLILKISDNRNEKKLTVSRKKASILKVNRKSHSPIETLSVASIWMVNLEFVQMYCGVVASALDLDMFYHHLLDHLFFNKRILNV